MNSGDEKKERWEERGKWMYPEDILYLGEKEKGIESLWAGGVSINWSRKGR